jgi:hypothetical protein
LTGGCGLLASVGVVQEELIGVKLFREGDRFPLSRVEVVERRIGGRAQGVHLEPRRKIREPAPDRLWRLRVPKFVKHCRWDCDSFEESPQKVRLLTEDQGLRRARATIPTTAAWRSGRASLRRPS